MAMHVHRVFGEGADIEVHFGVVLVEASNECMHGREEGVVVADDEPFAAAADAVEIHCWDEREVTFGHFIGAEGSDYLHIDAVTFDFEGRIPDLFGGGIN